MNIDGHIYNSTAPRKDDSIHSLFSSTNAGDGLRLKGQQKQQLDLQQLQQQKRESIIQYSKKVASDLAVKPAANYLSKQHSQASESAVVNKSQYQLQQQSQDMLEKKMSENYAGVKNFLLSSSPLSQTSSSTALLSSSSIFPSTYWDQQSQTPPLLSPVYPPYPVVTYQQPAAGRTL
jgi:hypothetical protein